ncbi:hypothetical protein PRZ48_015236 [Zasmidium cellare]|uniref:F-box domain-containing protein n=1 Tax=Zasmidium cellare TaxID=395010 RepID=A0ABR0DY03_ZASCE|nr:hypothetical protein PRZ48_015236 [Zasmidium cellare]
MLWNIKDAGAFRFNGTVRGEEGLTFGKLLDLVLAESSGAWTFIGFTHQLGSANKKILDVPGDTPGETIRRLERRLGGKAELQGEKSYEMSSDNAQHKVFQVNELLEHVLLQLPWKDLFMCQSVSRRFRDVVAGSTSLKQKMFLLLRDSSVSPQESSLKICPALDKYPYRRQTPSSTNKSQAQEVVRLIRPPANVVEESSWHKLYLTDPPVRKMWATLSWTVNGNDDTWATIHYLGYVEPSPDEDGFTIGNMIDAALFGSQGTVNMDASWIPRRPELFPVPGTAIEVISRAESQLGVKAKFKEGTVRFML